MTTPPYGGQRFDSAPMPDHPVATPWWEDASALSSLPPTNRVARIWPPLVGGIFLCALVAATFAFAPLTKVVAGTPTRAQSSGPSSFPAASSDATPVPTSKAPVPTSKASTKGGVPFTSMGGRFKATFPATPTVNTPLTAGGITVTAAVTHDPLAEVGSEILSAPMPESEQLELMRAAVGAPAAEEGLTIDSQRTTTFRGHSARVATCSSGSGTSVTIEIFFTSATAMYFVLGEKGPVFDGLLTSFVAG